ncbi:MAG: DNA polymerase III subunit beta [Alphaproteobacteria bacterium]
MKLTIERAALLKSLAHVQSVVERRNTIPILSNVRIEARKDSLGLTATDMDLAVVDTAPAQVAQGGATTAPAHVLYDIVRKLPDGAQLELDNAGDSNHLRIRSGRSTFRLPCLPTEDFPVMAEGDLPSSFQIAAADLRTLVDHSFFAISTEETRYYLNGIFLHATARDGVKVLRAVATDGHRLARIESPLPAGAEAIPGVIVPRKTVAELRRLIDESTDTVRIALSDSKIRFAFDGAVITSKLIDGTFPDYERVIPTGNDRILEVDSRAFANAVDRVSTISSERSRAVKLSVKRGHLVLSTTSPDNGSATEELEVAYAGDDIDVGFNARYVLDITQQIEGDTLRLAFADAASPTLASDVADASALYVLMPMRV